MNHKYCCDTKSKQQLFLVASTKHPVLYPNTKQKQQTMLVYSNTLHQFLFLIIIIFDQQFQL